VEDFMRCGNSLKIPGRHGLHTSFAANPALAADYKEECDHHSGLSVYQSPAERLGLYGFVASPGDKAAARLSSSATFVFF
jgi:hypothetical protein